MDSDALYLAAIYAAPFLLLGFLPGWRSIAAGAAFSAAFLLWAFLLHTRPEGFAGAVEFILAWIAGTGLAGGMLASLIVKLAKDRGFTAPFQLAIRLAVFLAVPLVSYAIVEWMKL